MILERYKPGQFVAGQELLYKFELFGKEYYMLRDIDGTKYSTKIDEYGNPVWI